MVGSQSRVYALFLFMVSGYISALPIRPDHAFRLESFHSRNHCMAGSHRCSNENGLVALVVLTDRDR